MKENETIDDIIAEMEHESAQMFPALPIAVLQLASRLKAAIARERAAQGNTSGGAK
jgi:hypothetical protein